MSEELDELLNDDFQLSQDEYTPRVTPKPSPVNTSSIEALHLMDLDAYNYLSGFLFEGMGTEEVAVMQLDVSAKLDVFRAELIANTRLLDMLNKPEVMSLPTLKRLSIGASLLAIEELHTIRASFTPDNGLPADNFSNNSRMAKCYEKLLDFLVGDALTSQEKTESIVLNMFIEFKTLQYLSHLAAGNHSDGEYLAWVTDEAKINLETIVSLSSAHSQGFPDESVIILNRELRNRKEQIYSYIETGQVDINPATSIENEQTLIKCFMSIAISANTEALPILHPAYHINGSACIKRKSKILLEQLRRNRGAKDAKPDIKKNVSKKKSRNRNTSSVYLSENNSDGNERPARTRKLWTDEESKALEEGIALYGHDWVAIHKSYPDILRDRSPVNLKDRARSLRRIREREGTAPGTYPLAPS